MMRKVLIGLQDMYGYRPVYGALEPSAPHLSQPLEASRDPCNDCHKRYRLSR